MYTSRQEAGGAVPNKSDKCQAIPRLLHYEFHNEELRQPHDK